VIRVVVNEKTGEFWYCGLINGGRAASTVSRQ
jgi:hypothetical protein